MQPLVGFGHFCAVKSMNAFSSPSLCRGGCRYVKTSDNIRLVIIHIFIKSKTNNNLIQQVLSIAGYILFLCATQLHYQPQTKTQN